jgi:2-haloacid dehalogenase
MLAGPIEGTVEILKQLKKGNQFKIYALTNWSAETFPKALKLYDFLNWFDGVVVSGTEKMRKPSSAFYKLLLDRYNVRAEEALFVDDNKRNTDAAQQVGIDSIVFTTPETLVAELQNRGIQW